MGIEIHEMYERGGIWCWGHVSPGEFVKAALEDGYDEVGRTLTVGHTLGFLKPPDENCDEETVDFDVRDDDHPGARPVTYMVF